MIFLTVTFGLAALILFGMAFSNVFKGKMGQAIAFALVGLIVAGLAGLTQTI